MNHDTSALPILPQSSDLPRGHVSCAEREAMIAERAYFLAQGRGFAPGHELEDWLSAEREVAALIVSAAT